MYYAIYKVGLTLDSVKTGSLLLALYDLGEVANTTKGKHPKYEESTPQSYGENIQKGFKHVITSWGIRG